VDRRRRPRAAAARRPLLAGASRAQRPPPRRILLAELRANEARLKGFKLFSAVRLSVMPVAPEHWERILALENRGQTTIS
jgi:predicted RNA-binding protein with PUA-like domain